MIEPHARWMAPSPLWTEARVAADANALRQPTLLRFASDSFMDEFIALLEAEPARLGELRAVPETWRGPAPRSAPVEPLPAFRRDLSRRQLAERAGGNGLALASKPVVATARSPRLKLYQPAHQRYYLVSSCLVCQTPGFPDRVLDPARPEKATFVLRRLRAPDHPEDPSTRHEPAKCVEYAYVLRGQLAGWQRVNTSANTGGDVVLPGEEELPLSGLNFAEDDGRKRRLLVGLIPVGRRESYIGAPELGVAGTIIPPPTEAGGPPRPNPRLLPLQIQVTGPWKNIIEQSDVIRKALASTDPKAQPPTQVDRASLVRITRDRIQTSSWYALLDLANYLEAHLPAVWQSLTGKATGLQPREQALVDKLSNTTLSAGLTAALLASDKGATSVPASLAKALTAAKSAELQLEGVVIPFVAGQRTGQPFTPPTWPAFVFPLAEPDPTLNVPLDTFADVDVLEKLIQDALPVHDSGPMPEPQGVLQPSLDPRGNDWFVIRCVFQRPNCDPIAPPLVSVPSHAFELAGFFDADAPARPIRIGLPVDISPAGLRKANKNTVFVLSDLLCGQVNRMKGLSLGDLVLSVLPWPFHKDLPLDSKPGPCAEGGVSFGMICSLSIPIITIVALILLIIFVTLFDLIFHWLPYFMICFPFPKFRAKETT